MPQVTKADWKAWNKERKQFAKREAQGFTAEINTLEQHIKTLREVCPKDNAGYPLIRALMVFNELQQRLDEAKRYLATVGG